MMMIMMNIIKIKKENNMNTSTTSGPLLIKEKDLKRKVKLFTPKMIEKENDEKEKDEKELTTEEFVKKAHDEESYNNFLRDRKKHL